MQSAFLGSDSGRPGEKLSRLTLGGGSVQARFASIGHVAMDDPTLCCPIERGDERPMTIRGGRDFCHLGQGSQIAHHLAITQSAARALTSAFGGGLGIGHKFGRRRLVDRLALVKESNPS